MNDSPISNGAPRSADTPPPIPARLLHPNDDVATALTDLPKGAVIHVSSGTVVRDVTLQDDIRTGHKFAVRPLAAGLRVRKYGEFIGRTTAAVAAGAWVHVHNLVTSTPLERNAVRASQGAAQGKSHTGSRVATQTPPTLQALGRARCSVGENPLYDEARDRLLWIDVRDTPAIHAIDLKTSAETRWPMREDVGSAALVAIDDRRNGGDRLLVALRSGFAFFDCGTGSMTPIVDPEPKLPRNRLNDGKCDAAGRYWCGSMNPDSGSADGSLYVLERDLRCRKVLDDLVTPNGMTWSLDGKTMYLADTRRGYIYAFAFDAANGTLGERRVFADLGGTPGGPDGATIDADGYLWSAQFEGGCLIRYAPDGSIDRIVKLPVTKPTSCAFGGAGYRQLFVTTASRGLSGEQLSAEPLAGRVLVLDVGVAGWAPIRFAPTKEMR